MITNGERQLQGTQLRGSHTSRGAIVHNLPNGVRLRKFPGSIELLGDASDEALEQLVHAAKQRFESRHIKLLGSRDVQRRLARIAADRGLQIAPERER